MWFFQRNLPPVEIDEFAALVTLEALEWHIGYLTDRMRKARDEVDRQAWATARVERFVLNDLRRRIRDRLVELGPPSFEAASEVSARITGYGYSLPQSAANAEILRAEREAKAKTETERKQRRSRAREASRRMAGGKWARPRIVVSDDAGEANSNDVP